MTKALSNSVEAPSRIVNVVRQEVHIQRRPQAVQLKEMSATEQAHIRRAWREFLSGRFDGRGTPIEAVTEKH